MSRVKKRLLYLLLMFFPLLLFLCWLWATPLLTVALEVLASFFLQAEVSIETAALSGSTLHLQGVAIEHFRQTTLQSFQAAEVFISFHPLELWQGQVRAVTLHQPVIIVKQAAESSEVSAPPLSLQEVERKVPLLESFHLIDGKLELISPERQLGLTGLQVTLALSEQQTFHFSLRGSTFPETFPLTIESRLDLSSASPQGELSLSFPSLPLPLLALFIPADLLPPALRMDGLAQIQLSTQIKEEGFRGEMKGELARFSVGFPDQMTTPEDRHFTLHFSGSLAGSQPRIEEATLTVSSLGQLSLLTPLDMTTFSTVSLAFQFDNLQDLAYFLIPFTPALRMQGKGSGKIELQKTEKGSHLIFDAQFTQMQITREWFNFSLQSLAVQVTVEKSEEATTLPLTGKIEGTFRDGESFAIHSTILYKPDEAQWQFIPLSLTFAPKEKIVLEGAFSVPLAPQTRVNLTYHVQSLPLGKSRKLLEQMVPTLSLPPLQGILEARGVVEGSLTELAIHGKGSVKQGQLMTDYFTWRGTIGEIEYHLRYPSLTFSLRSLTGEVRSISEPAPLPSFTLGGEGTLNLSTLDYTLRQGALQVTKEETLTLSGQGKLSSPQTHTLNFQGDQWAIDRIWEMLRTERFPDYQEWVVGGKLSWQGKGKVEEIPQGYTYALTNRIRIEGGNLQSPDGTKALANLETTVEATIQGDTIKKTFSLHTQGSIGNFETLFGEFGEIYASFPGKFLQFESTVKVNSKTTSPIQLNGQGSFGHSGSVHFSGMFNTLTPRPTGEISASLSFPSLETFYQHYILEPFQTTFPLLQTLQVAGVSNIEAQLKRHQDELFLRGSLDLRKGRVQWSEKNIELSGVNIALPFTLRFPAPPTPRAPTKQDYGTLTFHQLLLPSWTLSDISLQGAVVDNAFTLKDHLILPVFGGTIDLSQLHFQHPFSDQRQLSAALQIKPLDLQALTKTYGPVPIAGKLSGSFPRIFLQGDRVETKGEITIQAFGGNIQVVNIGAGNLFSPIPSLYLTLIGKGLDLAQITKSFGFGLITGTLDVYLYELELVNGEPQSFEAVIETVEQSGKEQRISIDAIEQLTTLEGGSGSVFDKSFYGFFQEYSYEKIGIWAKLQHDTFFLRGMLRRGDQELFLKGRGLPRLDIVNHAPPQGVSFKEMVKRLQRIGATSGSPKISPSQ